MINFEVLITTNGTGIRGLFEGALNCQSNVDGGGWVDMTSDLVQEIAGTKIGIRGEGVTNINWTNQERYISVKYIINNSNNFLVKVRGMNLTSIDQAPNALDMIKDAGGLMDGHVDFTDSGYNLDLPNLKIADYMFAGTKVSKFIGTINYAKLTSYNNMYKNCYNITNNEDITIDIGGKEIFNMLSNNTSLAKQVRLVGVVNLRGVTGYNGSKIVKLDFSDYISLIFDSFSTNRFYSMPLLEEIIFPKEYKIKAGFDLNNNTIFNGLSKLKYISNFDTRNGIKKGSIFNGDLSALEHPTSKEITEMESTKGYNYEYKFPLDRDEYKTDTIQLMVGSKLPTNFQFGSVIFKEDLSIWRVTENGWEILGYLSNTPS